MQKERASWPGWYGWMAMLASSLAFSTGALVIGLHANAESDRRNEATRVESDRKDDEARVESDRRWCTLLDNLDRAYKEIPPSTPTGRNVAQEIHRLRTDPQPTGFGCPP